MLHKFYDSKRDQMMCDDIIVLDLETTSAWLDPDGDVVGLNKVDPNKDDILNLYKPITLTYLWGIGINDQYFYGRRLEELKDILDWFPKNMQIYMYIHNSGYEFAFFQNILTYCESIIRISYKPILYWFKEYPNIIFRCSWQLTQMSLKEWGSILGIPKLDTLNYSKIRTPLTNLKKSELAYSLRDLEIMTVGLMEYKRNYKHVAYIPITQTGAVRRRIKNILMRDRKWIWKMRNMFPRDSEEMKLITSVYWGGWVQASPYYVNETLKNVYSYDIDSSYIYSLCCHQYPITPWKRDNYKVNDPEKVYIMRVQIDQIQSLTAFGYISISKCSTRIDAVAPNGRLIKAERIVLCCTHVDLEQIKKLYKYKKIRILQSWSSFKGYLPRDLIIYMLEMHKDKTYMKGNDDYRIQYSSIKKEINAIGGMMATAPVTNPIQYSNRHLDQRIWKKNKLTEYEVDSLLKEEKEHAFLSLSHAAFMTAYARQNLVNFMLGENQKVENFKKIVYIDTDGLKFIDFSPIEWYNKSIMEKIQKASQELDIDINLFLPVDMEGNKRPLGYMEKENVAEEFRTLGGKQYCSRINGKLKLTCSGINKEAVSCLKDDIENFKKGFVFNYSNPDVHTKQLIYINDPTMKKVVWNKGKKDEYVDQLNRFGCHISDRSYSLSRVDIFEDLLNEERAWCKFDKG